MLFYISYSNTFCSLLITGICELTVRAISIIVRLSNSLQIFLAVVRTSGHNSTACILPIVASVFVISSV